MAKRASETFHVWLEDGKRTFEKDQVIPAEVARKIEKFEKPVKTVYDDGAK